MKDQLKTIREGIEKAHIIGGQDGIDKALAALTQLEAMVGEQEPVAWMVTSEMQDGTRNTYPLSGRYKDVRDICDFGDPVPLVVAPVAQQPHVPEADCGNIDWKAQYEHQKRRAEMWIAKYEADIGPLEKAGPVAQQPQAEAVQQAVKKLHMLIMPVPAKDVTALDVCKAVSEQAREIIDILQAAPQQAEAVPSDVVRDAERWRTFLATRPANTHAVINDAIDAATAKGEKS